ncbi:MULTISPECIES: DUF3999 family protein [unclassified Massilia]|uniref:DUF3999 family protein n=1 Tax=unclassified Massilia TaxID=2609279 RepID=UPI001787080E|nr:MULTISPECIES: DUF3999 family protein [unclassified Massilia]MBD8530403.1 DUF3999 family protein [Massilia sp. CFBP 13647]MBD8674299.1 DUF3999 family protein [Massilia sp. CFBP 13721]
MPALPARLRIAFVSLAATAFTVAAASQGDSPGDYAYRIPLSASGTQAVVQLQLPRAVYLEARSADLRDLRVFDAAGTALPFALFEPAAQSRETRSTAPVAVFRVRASAGAPSRLPDGLQIRTDASGAVISVTAPQARSSDEVLDSLVLDLHGATPAAKDAGPVGALVLSLPPGMNSYGARVALEASDDLASWETLVETSVSWLDNGQGASVRKDRIEFAPRAFRFARIRWLEGTPVEFGAIHAERIARLRTPAQYDSVALRPRSGTAGQDLLYDAPIGVPADAVGLELHGQNVVLPALIGHYRKLAGTGHDNLASVQLQPVANATFFQLIQNGQRRSSGDIDIAPTHTARWVVRPQAKIADRPGLRLRWTPARIAFLAGGKGPYTLAFGHGGAQSNQVPLSQVAPGFSMRELAALEQAKAGEPVRQDGAGSDNTGSEAGGAQSTAKQSLWLWALLVAGVAVLGLMAWKLARQLKEGDPDRPAA